jgi:hypothetical protein
LDNEEKKDYEMEIDEGIDSKRFDEAKYVANLL